MQEKIKTLDQEPENWRLVFKKYEELAGVDRVFKKIARSIENGWDDLAPEQKQRLLREIEGLFNKLLDYRDAYKNFKGMAGRRFYFEDSEKLRESVREADAREKILHDSLIDTLNILSRKMKTMGLDNSWRGDDEIFGITEEAKRQKPKLWMLKLFREKI